MNPTLRCKDVTIRYEESEETVLTEICFSVARGERVALVGQNGAGKTSLLLAIVGLVPSEGTVVVCGEVLNTSTLRGVRSQVGFLFNVPEDQLLFPTAQEDVSFGLLRKGVPKDQAFESARVALDRLGVAFIANKPLHHLSHGQKQRVALAGALVTEPSLLLLDEPTAGLDPIACRELAGILMNLGSAQLIATHDLAFAEAVCSRVVLLESGGIVEEVTNVSDVRSRWELP